MSSVSEFLFKNSDFIFTSKLGEQLLRNNNIVVLGAQALYGNSEAGKLLAKANPNTLKEVISWMGFFDEGLKQLPEVVKKGKYNIEIAI